ncbi:hypothetical protein GCM10027589_07830 [Actinocorallia lasiicapitis]
MTSQLMRRSKRGLAIALSAAAAASALFAMAPAQAAPPLIVTLTFDDSLASQRQVINALNARGVKGTFYVNSGRVGTGGNWLNWADVKGLQNTGHEVGGHTLTHARLTEQSPENLQKQICDDRNALIAQGLDAKSLAYPYGAYNDAVQAQAKACGYDNARRTGPIRPDGAPYPAETLPPRDRFAIAAPASYKNTTTVDTIKNYVQNAIAAGGTWLPMTFHDICATAPCGDEYGVGVDVINQFLDWAAGQPVVFKTVKDALGGGGGQQPQPKNSDLKTTIVGPAQAKPGTPVAYTVTTASKGDGDATGVKTVVQAPGLTGITAPGCAVAGTQITCEYGNVGKGQERKSTIFGKVGGQPGQTLKVTANAASTSKEATAGDNGAELGTVVLKPDAVLTADLKLTAKVTGKLKSKKNGQLTLRLVNIGNGPAKNVTLRGTLPSGVKILKVKGCKRNGRTAIRCTAADFKQGRVATIVVTFKAPQLKKPVIGTFRATVTTPTVERTLKNNSIKISRRFAK